jgi:hypothetical protein
VRWLLFLSYDNLGRMRQASTANHAVQLVYDALGRVEIENSFFGQKTMEYDLAGRMTKLTHQDGPSTSSGQATSSTTSIWSQAR